LQDDDRDPGRAFMHHSETLARAGRYFNSARKGFSTTLKELQALQTKRKSEEEPESSSAAHPEPIKNKSVAVKLVSFRQQGENPDESPAPIAQPDPESEEKPPLAA
jgi:hypothetical protein